MRIGNRVNRLSIGPGRVRPEAARDGGGTGVRDDGWRAATLPGPGPERRGNRPGSRSPARNRKPEPGPEPEAGARPGTGSRSRPGTGKPEPGPEPGSRSPARNRGRGPHVARVYGYLLGGTDNTADDRAAGDHIIASLRDPSGGARSAPPGLMLVLVPQWRPGPGTPSEQDWAVLRLACAGLARKP